MPLWASFTYKLTMTIAPVNTSVLAQFIGEVQDSYDMMIGIALVKESDAVFFEYQGDKQQPVPLMLSNGRPLTYLRNVRLAGISIAEDIGEFNSTKLNIILEAGGKKVLVTSGLTTLWSQAVMTGLMGLFNSYDLDTAFTLNTWKGTSKMRPAFASIKLAGDVKVSDQMLYDQLCELRGDRATDKIKAVMRDSVEILAAGLVGGMPALDVVVEEPKALTSVEEALDF